MPPKRLVLLPTLLLAAQCASGQGWWMTEPIRWVQTNLRQTDAGIDPVRLAQQLAEMRANVVLQSMGGISANYPTAVPFHYASPHLPAGRDLFGEFLREAHSRRIRVVGRYDLSKTRKDVFDAHPEWFFRQANGEPVIYNGLYSTCINGDYYRVQAMKVLAEGLEKYDVDGLFFNMFGNQSRDYGGREVGLCHCGVCTRRYRELHNAPIPEKPDERYRQFMFQSSRAVAARIGELIHRLRPKAGYFNYIQEHTDGIMSESNTAVARPLPLWPYAAASNVNRARSSQPGKMSVDLNMQFVDYWWRFATVPAGEIALRSWQHLANGGALTFAINGTPDLQDRQALNAVKPIFRWAAENERYYAGQLSAARVLLLGAPPAGGRTFRDDSYRGLFRLLSELHVPFAVSDNLDWMGKREFDLVLAADWAPPELGRYVEAGGKLLVVSSRPPEVEIAPVVRTDQEVRGYVRVRSHAAFPSLGEVDLLMLDGAFTHVKADGPAPLTLVPPSMFGPPEFIHIDMKETDVPAIASRTIGRGEATWIPWDLALLYYRHSLPAHAALVSDLLGRMLPRRQIVTNAHPLVSMTLMKQGDRTLLHLINLSGHSQTGYFAPVPMTDIRVTVDGRFARARSLRNPAVVALKAADGRTEFNVPRLLDYEVIVLEGTP